MYRTSGRRFRSPSYLATIRPSPPTSYHSSSSSVCSGASTTPDYAALEENILSPRAPSEAVTAIAWGDQFVSVERVLRICGLHPFPKYVGPARAGKGEVAPGAGEAETKAEGEGKDEVEVGAEFEAKVEVKIEVDEASEDGAEYGVIEAYPGAGVEVWLDSQLLGTGLGMGSGLTSGPRSGLYSGSHSGLRSGLHSGLRSGLHSVPESGSVLASDFPITHGIALKRALERALSEGTCVRVDDDEEEKEEEMEAGMVPLPDPRLWLPPGWMDAGGLFGEDVNEDGEEREVEYSFEYGEIYDCDECAVTSGTVTPVEGEVREIEIRDLGVEDVKVEAREVQDREAQNNEDKAKAENDDEDEDEKASEQDTTASGYEGRSTAPTSAMMSRIASFETEGLEAIKALETMEEYFAGDEVEDGHLQLARVFAEEDGGRGTDGEVVGEGEEGGQDGGWEGMGGGRRAGWARTVDLAMIERILELAR